MARNSDIISVFQLIQSPGIQLSGILDTIRTYHSDAEFQETSPGTYTINDAEGSHLIRALGNQIWATGYQDAIIDHLTENHPDFTYKETILPRSRILTRSKPL